MKNQNKKSDNGKTGKTTPEESPVLVTGESGLRTIEEKVWLHTDGRSKMEMLEKALEGTMFSNMLKRYEDSEVEN